MASKQELAKQAGELVAATVDSLNSYGVNGTPMDLSQDTLELAQDTWEATEAALTAGATGEEIRRAGGLDTGQQAGGRR